MHSHQRSGARGGQVTIDNRDRLLSFILNAVDDNSKVTELGRQTRLSGATDQLLADSAVGDQLFNANDLQVALLGNRYQSISRGPITRLVQDFAQGCGGVQSGHPDKVDRRFGVSGTPQHATLLGQQWKNVTGANEIFGLTIERAKLLNGLASFGCRDSRFRRLNINRR